MLCNMFGYSLIHTKKLAAIYDKIAILAGKLTIQSKYLTMEIKGKIIQNLGIQSGTTKAGKQWSKATVLIETEGLYPKKVVLDNLKNAEEFSKLAVGSVGTFHVELSSNEYNGRWYTSVNCWKWELDAQQAQPTLQSATPTLDAMGVSGYQHATQQATPPETDDLPF